MRKAIVIFTLAIAILPLLQNCSVISPEIENPIAAIENYVWNGSTGDIYEHRDTIAGILGPWEKDKLTNRMQFRVQSVTKETVSGIGTNYPYYIESLSFIGGSRFDVAYKYLTFTWIYTCSNKTMVITYDEPDEVVKSPVTLEDVFIYEDSFSVKFGDNHSIWKGKEKITDFVDFR